MRIKACSSKNHRTQLIFGAVPIESIAHLNCDQHRQSHGHGRSGLKDFAVQAGEVLVLIMALHEVRLHREKVRSATIHTRVSR